ncbi:MAG: DNA polymerase III subunit chi [Spongiibacteraceae bacterium]|jgi:DNA polymerase-3 subunit chi|nr:DNA polymerase III subunit chi [Spongiibacteraceae bacterium]
MTEVSFYVLASGGAEERALFACRLTEKAYALGNRVHIHLRTEAEAAHFDELLWSFRPSSFIPHARIEAASPAPVTIGTASAPPPPAGDLLINLGGEVPSCFSSFLKVAEVVSTDPEVQRMTRDHYRFYRDHGYPLQTHRLRS